MTEKKEPEQLKSDDPAELSLVGKIIMASRLIGAVAKDGNNQAQHYAFQSEAAIKSAVKQAANTAGVIIIPNYEIVQQYEHTTKNGSIMHFVDVLGHFQITDGKDRFDSAVPGTGSDAGEKAMMKATTAAQKQYYKQMFNISDQETDPDADDSRPDGGFRPDNSAPTQPMPPATDRPPLASKQETDIFQLLAQDFANKQGIDVKTLLSFVFKNAKVDNKAWSQITSDELGLLKIELNKMMG